MKSENNVIGQTNFFAIPFDQRVAMVELKKEREEMYPDVELNHFKEKTKGYSCSKRARAVKNRHQRKKILTYILKERGLR